MRILGVSVLGLLELTACSRGSAEARHTVEEYRSDSALRRTQVTRCRQYPGTLRKTPDCINAETAAAFEYRLRLQDAPPMGLEPKPAPAARRHEE